MKTEIEKILRDEYADYDQNSWHYEHVFKMLTKAYAEGKAESDRTDKDVKNLLKKAFSAGRNYQIGEYEEDHYDRDNNNMNFDEWFKRVESELTGKTI
jgi:hypothetical protein